jgi:hypothetical protein
MVGRPRRLRTHDHPLLGKKPARRSDRYIPAQDARGTRMLNDLPLRRWLGAAIGRVE